MKYFYLILIQFFMFNTYIQSQTIITTKEPCDSIRRSQLTTKLGFALVEREPQKLPLPDNPYCELGNYSFSFFLNREGEVISVIFNSKYSTEISEVLKVIMMESIKGYKFSANSKAPKKQRGTITFFISLEEK